MVTTILTIILIGLGELALSVYLFFKDKNLLAKALLVLNPLSLVALPLAILYR